MTKEEWIEQEARKARARYWERDVWIETTAGSRQDWRNVVAPYYQEPVADADTLEKLAEVAVNAYMEHPNIGNDPVLGRAMEAAVVAVLRAAKPRIDYEQVRIAFSECMSPKEWAEYINSRIRYRFELPQPQPEPLRVPVDVDGLARVMCDAAHAHNPCFNSRWYETAFQNAYRSAARAALAYLNIEPCAMPDDVAFRDALKKSQEIVNNWTPEQRNHNSIGYVGLQGNERAELENLRAECKRLRDYEAELLERRKEQAKLFNDNKCYKVECVRLRNEIKRLREKYDGVVAGNKALADDLLAIKQAGTQQPVKVRFDVTAEDIRVALACTKRGEFVSLEQWYLDYLAAHAVIDVPPGVPTLEELAKMGYEILRETYRSKGHIVFFDWKGLGGDEKESYTAQTAAIRDRILAGIQRREWTDQDVEELAGILRREAGWTETSWHETSLAFRESWRKQCRAALAWFDRKRGE